MDATVEMIRRRWPSEIVEEVDEVNPPTLAPEIVVVSSDHEYLTGDGSSLRSTPQRELDLSSDHEYLTGDDSSLRSTPRREPEIVEIDEYVTGRDSSLSSTPRSEPESIVEIDEHVTGLDSSFRSTPRSEPEIVEIDEYVTGRDSSFRSTPWSEPEIVEIDEYVTGQDSSFRSTPRREPEIVEIDENLTGHDSSLRSTPPREPEIVELTSDHEYVSGHDSSFRSTPPRELTTEELFIGVAVPPWREQLTLRALVVGFILSLLFVFTGIKVNLTTGLVLGQNIPAGLLGFSLIYVWIFIERLFGRQSRPFTRQENTILQTIVGSAAEMAFSGGYGSYLLAMTSSVADQAGEDKNAYTIKLSLSWIYPFLLCVCFPCIFMVAPIRKMMITKLRLDYPSGTAAGELINELHTPRSPDLIPTNWSQGKLLAFASFGSLVWACFKWGMAGGKGCGINNIPTFGFAAYKQRLFFDSSATYIGVGMISPYKMTYSITIGALLSLGVWALISAQKGNWYGANLSNNDLHGLQGYKVIVPFGFILGDILYSFTKVVYHFIKVKFKASINILPSREHPPISFDDERRERYFAEDPIAIWKSILVYIGIGIISIFFMSTMFHFVRWSQFVVLYFSVAPFFSFCNAYVSGVTDWSLAASYGRVVIFIIAAWVGKDNGGVIIGLVACGVVTTTVSFVACSTHDMKSAFMTLTSPRAMLIAQIVGVSYGVLLCPIVFYLFLVASPDLGSTGSEYPAPNALVYRLMSLIGVEGLEALPKYWLPFFLTTFIGALVINAVKDIGEIYQKPWVRFMPQPTTMAIPFYVGASFAIDMLVGSAIYYLKGLVNKSHSDSHILASGLIVGEAMWSIFSSVLALFGIKSSMCLQVVPSSAKGQELKH